MMDTVLNLGLNDETVKGLAKWSGNEWFAYDAYRRFLQMFGKIVLSIDEKLFSSAWEEIKRKYGAKEDPEVPLEGLKEAVERFKQIILRERGGFPQDPWEQLRLAIKAVFKSWMSPRAIFYRIIEKITPDVADCTAVNVVTMVFGNVGWDSGTGVVFSRDVATGENKLYGEFLPVAQGEDVVAGIRTPMRLLLPIAPSPAFGKALNLYTSLARNPVAALVELGNAKYLLYRYDNRFGVKGVTAVELYETLKKLDIEVKLRGNAVKFTPKQLEELAQRGVSVRFLDEIEKVAAREMIRRLEKAKKRAGRAMKPQLDVESVRRVLVEMAKIARIIVAQYKRGEYIRIIPHVAKLQTARIAVDVARRAVQLEGGYGYSKESKAEMFYRDAKILEIGEGTNEVMKYVLFKLLEKR